MKSTKFCQILVIFLVLPFAWGYSQETGNDPVNTSHLMVGTAIRNITPTARMFPIGRSLRSSRKMEAVMDSVHVRAIAFSSGGAKTLMICSEIGRCHPQVADEVAKHTGLPLESIFITTSHSHATPELTQEFNLDFLEGAEENTHQLWAKYAIQQIVSAAEEALSEMEPATVGIGYSQSYVNVNRQAKYNRIAEDGKVTEYYNFGYNPTGPSDKTVAAIQFNGADGKPVAFIINYPVHGTVMHANSYFNGTTGVSADLPGMISGFLEDKYDGSVAIWTSGAAGDQNPIVQNDVYTRNPLTGEFEENYSNSYDICKYLSKIHFTDVEKALSGISNYSADVSVRSEFMASEIPAKENGSYPVSVQLLRIGDIAMVGLSGEMFTAIGMYMKQHSLLKNTIIVTHAWQRRFQNPGYHADDESIPLNGPGCNAGYKPGYLTEELTSMMNSLIKETNN